MKTEIFLCIFHLICQFISSLSESDKVGNKIINTAYKGGPITIQCSPSNLEVPDPPLEYNWTLEDKEFYPRSYTIDAVEGTLHINPVETEDMGYIFCTVKSKRSGEVKCFNHFLQVNAIPKISIEENFEFTADSCDEIEKTVFQEKLGNLIEQKFCTPANGCNVNSLKVDCKYHNNFIVSVPKYAVSVQLTLYNSVTEECPLACTHELLRHKSLEIIQDELTPLISSLNLGLNNFSHRSIIIKRAKAKSTCEKGHIKVNEECEPCKPGTRKGKANECVPCYKGYYNDQKAQIRCKPCPKGQSTVSPGSDTMNNCKEMGAPLFVSIGGIIIMALVIFPTLYCLCYLSALQLTERNPPLRKCALFCFCCCCCEHDEVETAEKAPLIVESPSSESLSDNQTEEPYVIKSVLLTKDDMYQQILIKNDETEMKNKPD